MSFQLLYFSAGRLLVGVHHTTILVKFTMIVRLILFAIAMIILPMRMLSFRSSLSSFTSSSSSWSRALSILSTPISQSSVIIPSTGNFTSISFFKFVSIQNPADMVERLKSHYVKTLPGIMGTVLLAKEGVNAQLVVPSSIVSCVAQVTTDVDPELFGDLDINVGQSIDYGNSKTPFPFKKLMVKVKRQILTDGMLTDNDDNNDAAAAVSPLDWTDAGPEIPPSMWHLEVSQRTDDIVVLDCRNAYESDMGTFLGAIPLNTTKFSETWDAVDSQLAGISKDTRILTYCTGGIRCVKVNAYLKQRLGFNNIGRLQNGIISYESYIEKAQHSEVGRSEVATDIVSTFVGKNFLFDRRRLESDDDDL